MIMIEQSSINMHLASSSPRRKELLEQLGVKFDIIVPDVDEARFPNESPNDYVMRLALMKAEAGFHKSEFKKPTLGSDTIVVFADLVLGKPKDQSQAIEMLSILSGRTHDVVTAVAIVDGNRMHSFSVETKVTFHDLTEQEALRYWRTGEPADKAGAYAIQGLGAVFVKRIEGSYSNVVGLPLYEVADMLKQFSIPYALTEHA